MSEEEKAIEILKYTRDKCRESGEGRIYFYRVEDLSNAIDTILNLIEKQQKEIEELKKKLKYDISKIDEKLHNNSFGENYINDYRKMRLKGMKTKSKEILKLLGE